MDIAGGGSERRITKWCSSSSRKEGVMEEAMHKEGKKARGEGMEQVISDSRCMEKSYFLGKLFF